jgi:hypothetical protein
MAPTRKRCHTGQRNGRLRYTYVVYKKSVEKGLSCGALTPNTLSELKLVEAKNIVTLQSYTLPDFKNRLAVRGELRDVSEV